MYSQNIGPSGPTLSISCLRYEGSDGARGRPADRYGLYRDISFTALYPGL
jgi:hypothetical protein